MYKTIQLSFGDFNLDNAPDNKFIWSGNFTINNNFFEGEIPVYIITNEQKVEEKTVRELEEIVLHIEDYLQKAKVFLKKILTEESVTYKIQPDESQYLELNPEDFPVDFPEITLWESDEEWCIRFAEGKFDICDPYGIAIYFKESKAIRIENLEDSESE